MVIFDHKLLKMMCYVAPSACLIPKIDYLAKINPRNDLITFFQGPPRNIYMIFAQFWGHFGVISIKMAIFWF